MSRPGFKANLSGWKPRLYAETKSARVELVPFPEFLLERFSFWERVWRPRYILPNGGHSVLNVATTRSLSSIRWMCH